MDNKRLLTIYFMDGSDMSINFPEQAGNPLLLAKRVQEAIDANQIAIEIDDQLYVIPTNNIKYMHVSPVPDELPETVIRGGSLGNN